jgi:hypothetical protein
MFFLSLFTGPERNARPLGCNLLRECALCVLALFQLTHDLIGELVGTHLPPLKKTAICWRKVAG